MASVYQKAQVFMILKMISKQKPPPCGGGFVDLCYRETQLSKQ